MAEPVGLALGVIALGSLFSTCMGFFEHFELGKNREYDYETACSKLALLKTRLDIWGNVLGVQKPGHEAQELRQNWSEEGKVISRTLLSISHIFEDADTLKDKYNLVPHSSTKILGPLVLRKKPGTASGQKSTSTQSNKPSRLSFLHHSTKWAIRDKKKFDALIDELVFFISNLEEVQKRLMPHRPIQQPQRLSSLGSSGTELGELRDENETANSQMSQTGTGHQADQSHTVDVQGKVVQEGNRNWVGAQYDQSHVFQSTGSAQEVTAKHLMSVRVRNSNEIGEMHNQATASQGFNSADHIAAVFAAREPTLAALNVSPEGTQPGAEESGMIFSGAGRRLGNE